MQNRSLLQWRDRSGLYRIPYQVFRHLIQSILNFHIYDKIIQRLCQYFEVFLSKIFLLCQIIRVIEKQKNINLIKVK